jgi:hypothetical protein
VVIKGFMGWTWKRWFRLAAVVIWTAALTAAPILTGTSGAQIGLIAAAAGTVVAAVATLTTVLEARGGPARAAEAVAQRTLEQRLDDLAASMRNSAQIVQQVSTELEARAATAKRLKEEAEAAEALSRLHKEESDAIGRMLRAQLEGATREIRRDSIKIGIVSFAGGAAASLLVTLLVHPLG